jgi:ABC-type sugar transport system substrate-binding protein
MVAAGATLAIAVHRDLAGSRGTKDCVRRAIAAGIPVYLIDSEDVRPRRITAI